jgi:hypothetical protein
MFLLKTLYWGQLGARDNYSLQIRNIVEHAYESLGEKPVIIGECGVPMDMKCVPKFSRVTNDLSLLSVIGRRSIPKIGDGKLG